ncbi:cation transporter [Marinobacter fonticola]|uniref:cation transporter n=1 Tax=Marinobacter fonticola TaxID=2603215 RepID=UPI0011E80BDF|nr:cation diffusion facilitator family transporter [Marinobacter fonticola]
MDSCCENKAGELAHLREKQARVLYVVLGINAVMFFFEFISGWLANSTALLGDSLDMFGDASVYALTLYTLHRSARAKASAALAKGVFMLLFGLVVIGDAVRKSLLGVIPEANWMGVVGLIALAANTVCFLLLYSHRSDDLNMRSTWLCSRNDLVANTSVIAAAVLVALTGTLWPDVVVGIAIAGLFLHSAWQVLTEAWREWRHANVPPDTESSVDRADTCCGAAASPLPVKECSSDGSDLDDHCGPAKAKPKPSCCGASTENENKEWQNNA